MANPQFAGLILMGGQSTRMGTDKAFAEWKGKSLLDNAIDSLKSLTDDIYLSVNARQFEILNDQYRCIEDLYPKKGPLGGIVSALKTLQRDLIVIAVDMPALKTQDLDKLIESSKQHRTVICYEGQGEIQPFPSFWHYDLYPTLEESLQNNHLSMRKLIGELDTKLLTTSDKKSFKNLNAPKDLDGNDTTFLLRKLDPE